jgi:hypothetical protein
MKFRFHLYIRKEFRISFKVSLIYTIIVLLLNLIRFNKLGIGYYLLIIFSAFYFSFQVSSWILERKYPILHSIYGGKALNVKTIGWIYAIVYFIAVLFLTYISLFGV